MSALGTFLSRNGVEHLLVSSGSGCATCGKPHLDRTHAQTVAHYLNGTPCRLVERQNYPYRCIAEDKHPDHVIIACTSHNAWWHTERPA